MDNAPAVIIMLTTIPALVGSILAATQATKTNRAARARRTSRSDAEATAK
ncbi:hypothetical protein [Microbacterium sp. USHLN186]